MDFRNMDSVTKFMLIALVGVIIYFLSAVLLKPIIIPDNVVSPDNMMNMMMGDHMMNFTNRYSTTLNTVSILIAVLIGFLISLKMRQCPPAEEKIGKVDETSIIKKALSNDEKRLLEEIEKAGEITQDSLRFRLNWSKAKVSAIVNNLDRLNILQRERQGKTYNIFLSKRQ